LHPHLLLKVEEDALSNLELVQAGNLLRLEGELEGEMFFMPVLDRSILILQVP